MACYDSSPYTCTYDSGGAGSLPGGGNPDYSSLSTWESASDNDLSGYSGPVILDCYDSQNHNAYFAMYGASNTSATKYRKIQSASGCSVPFTGKAGTGATFYYNFVGGGFVLTLEEAYSVLKQLCVTGSCNSPSIYAGVALGYSNTRIIGCVVYDCANANASMDCIQTGQINYALIANCITYGGDGKGIHSETQYRTGHGVLCNTCIGNNNGINLKGNGIYPAAGNVVFSNYCADNTSGDFTLNAYCEWGNLDLNSWNSSKDNTAPGNNYKRSNNLTDTELDADYLPTVADLFWSGGSTDNAGRNPYNDVSSTIDWDDFLKNDASGWIESKQDIRGTDRPNPDTAGSSWSVGAAEYLEESAPPAGSASAIMWAF